MVEHALSRDMHDIYPILLAKSIYSTTFCLLHGPQSKELVDLFALLHACLLDPSMIALRLERWTGDGDSPNGGDLGNPASAELHEIFR